MVPPELSLCSPLPSPLAMNNSPPEGPMRFVKIVLLVSGGFSEASESAPSNRKHEVTVNPNFLMENLPSDSRIVRFSRPRHNEFAATAGHARSARLQQLVLSV